MRWSAHLYLTLALWSCGRNTNHSAEAPPGEPTPAVAPLPASGASTTLTGRWNLVPDTLTPRRPGLQMTLAIDSGGAETFRGRVVFFFSGDVGIDPRIFKPFVGRWEDRTASIVVEPADRDAPQLTFAGRARGDTIYLDLFTMGPDTLSGGAVPWLLVRER